MPLPELVAVGRGDEPHTEPLLLNPMRRAGYRLWLAALPVLLAVTAVVTLLHGRRAPFRPDILVLTVDTLRADRLGAYGHEAARTPHIDSLARRGTVFTEATTPLPRTTPALASLLSGLWPQRHGSREVGQPLEEDAPLLSELLRSRGYATVAVSANGAAGPNQHLDRGFDIFVDEKALKRTRAGLVTSRALEEVARVPAERPLFLWVHWVDPHFPYSPPGDWEDQPAAETCRRLIQYASQSRTHTAHVVSDLGGRSSAALVECATLYDAEIAYTDFEIGRLLDGLAEAGRIEGAIVVFTADHGENLGEQDLFFQHGPNVHDASLKVPLIFAGPGIVSGVDRGVMRLEDVAPTLLGLIGEAPRRRSAMDGEDFSARLRERQPLPPEDGETIALAESGSALLVESFRYLVSGRARNRSCTNGPRFSLCGKPKEELQLFDHLTDPDLTVDLSDQYPEERAALLALRRRWPPEQARQRAARTTRFKLVELPRPEGGYRRALYDLLADPRERRDVSQEHPAVARRLQLALDRWTADLPTPEAPELSEEEIEALRALGYVN